MTMKAGRLIVFLIALFSLILTISAQNGAQKEQTNTPASPTDKFDDAHKGILGTQPDKAQEVGRFTESVARSLPGAAARPERMPRRNLIDEYIFDRIERDGIPHSGLSTDEEFVRRVYLDAQGVLPTTEEVKAFVANNDPEKRDKLIDSVIGSEKFAEQWAWFYGDLFRLMSYAGSGKDAFQFWLKEAFQVDRPYDEILTDLVTGATKSHSSVPQMAFLGRVMRNNGLKNRTPTDPDNYGANVNRLDGLDELTAEISRIFLGINIECISCHDGAGHLEPVNMYLAERTRKEFSQQAAFLGKLRLVGIYNSDPVDNIMDNEGKGYDTGHDAPYFTASESKFPRTGEAYQPAFVLTGERPKPGVDPRFELARMITSHPQFARATVNLIWGKLMTLGFVEPWDGFDLARQDPKNPPPKPWTVQPTNPELLNALADDFRAHHYSMHHLMKTIMKSNAYQLSSQFPAEWKPAYLPYYPRKYIRLMTGPEVADAIAQVTAQPYNIKFGDIKIERLKQLTDLGDIPAAYFRSVRASKEESKEGPEISALLNSFFETDRNGAVPIGNKPTTLQAILMMSSSIVNNRVIADGTGRLKTLLDAGKTNEEIVEELYLASLSRRPSTAEKKYVLESLPFNTDRKRATENLTWVLLNNIEFLVNH